MIALMALMSLAGPPAEPPSYAVEGKWSSVVEGVRVRLCAKRAKYAPGRPIELKLEVQNQSSETLHFPEPDFLPIIWYANDHPYDKDAYRWAVNLETPGQIVHIFWAKRQTAQRLREARRLPAGAIHVVEIEARPELAEERRDARKHGQPQRETLQWTPGEDTGKFILHVRYQAPTDRVMAGGFGKIRALRTPTIEIDIAD